MCTKQTNFVYFIVENVRKGIYVIGKKKKIINKTMTVQEVKEYNN